MRAAVWRRTSCATSDQSAPRRLSPWHLPGCLLWLRPDAGVSTTWGLVTRWVDRRHRWALVARAPTDCPTLVEQSPALGERRALRFDDGGGLLETAGTVPLSLDGELSLFVVLAPGRPWASREATTPLRARASRAARRLERTGAGARHARAVTLVGRPAGHWCASYPGALATLDRVIGIELDGHNELLAALEDGQIHATGVRLMAARAYLLGVVVSGPMATLFVNGVAASTFPLRRALAGAFTAKLRVGTGRGAADRFRGDIGDVLVYDRALDGFECALLAATLTRRYGIGGRRRPSGMDRFRSLLHRIRDRIASACWGTPRP